MTGDEKKQSGFSEMMTKAFSAGIGAVLMTQESLRTYLAESKLPRDIAQSILASTNAAKEQFFQYLSAEVQQLVKKSDLPKVMETFLRTHTLEIEAKIRFTPLPEAGKPESPPAPAEPSGDGATP